MDYCTLNCPRWNAGGGSRRSKPYYGMQEQGRSRVRAGGGTDLPQDTSPSHYNAPLPASRPCFMILYDTLGIYVQKTRSLGALCIPSCDHPGPLTLCFWLGSNNPSHPPLLFQCCVYNINTLSISIICGVMMNQHFGVLVCFKTYSVIPMLKTPFSCNTETLPPLSTS